MRVLDWLYGPGTQDVYLVRPPTNVRKGVRGRTRTPVGRTEGLVGEPVNASG